MKQAFYQVDAFADRPFVGNPAAVCPLASPAEADLMQAVATEMNLSETAFLVRTGAGEATFDLRWFTPAAEVDLCGHATLASAHVLWETESVAAGKAIEFSTRSGILTARQDGDWIEMDFPADPPATVDEPSELATFLGATPAWVGKSRLYDFALVESEETLRALEPDFRGLRSIVEIGIVVTAAADGPDYDFVSRFFAPAVGIDEDPVTGSAHTLLAPFWAGRLGRTSMTAFQASPRGGVVRVRWEGDRVAVAGRAVTVAEGELSLA